MSLVGHPRADSAELELQLPATLTAAFEGAMEYTDGGFDAACDGAYVDAGGSAVPTNGTVVVGGRP